MAVPSALICILGFVTSVRPDYMFYAVPVVFAGAGYACERVRQALKEYTLGGHVLTAAIIISMLPETVSYYTGRASADIRPVVARIKKDYRPGDRIYVKAEFSDYADWDFTREARVGPPNDNNVDWKTNLKRYECGPRTWFVLPIRRAPLARDLETWLIEHARLIWRKRSRRYDYTIDGYQVFLAAPNKPCTEPLPKRKKNNKPSIY